MVKFHNSDLWIAWVVLFCMEGSRFDLNTAKVCVGALDVTVSQSSVQVARGQTAVLPCSFTTSAALNNLNIIWMVIPLSNANQPEQVIIYQGGQVFSLADHLNGRVGFVATMPSTRASIFINNTQLTDTGTYQCLVNNFPDRGGRQIGVIGLTVLVPPSVPACRVQGSLDVGSDVLLMCSSEEGTPTPSYSWEKLDAMPRLPHTAMQDQMQGTVTLRNISSGTSGLYQCTSSNAVGKSTCLLNLQVVAPQPQSVGLIAGTIATGALALIICSLLVVVSLFYWRNKHKYDEEEVPNEIREDDLPPKHSSSVKAFHADASSSENDTLTSSNTYNSRYWHNPKANYDTHSYTRYNGDTRQTFSTAATHGAHVPHAPHAQSPGHHGHHGDHAHAHGQGHGHAHHGHGHGHHGHAHGHAPVPPVAAAVAAGPVSAPGSAPLPRHAPPPLPSATTPAAAAVATTTVTSTFANGSHTLPPPKTLVVTTNSAPSPAAKARGNGTVGHKAGVPAAAAMAGGGGSAGTGGGSARGQHTHSYAVSQATLERMGAVPVMVPAQNRAGSLV